MRTGAEYSIIKKHGEEVLILTFIRTVLSFHNSFAVLDKIDDRTESDALPKLSFLMLDFQEVRGIDSTGLAMLRELLSKAGEAGFHLIFSNASLELRVEMALYLGSESLCMINPFGTLEPYVDTGGEAEEEEEESLQRAMSYKTQVKTYR